MRAPRCVSAFPITNLKRRRLRRQSSFPLFPRLRPSTSPPPPLLPSAAYFPFHAPVHPRAAFPFSPLAAASSPLLTILFSIHRRYRRAVAWLRASCSLQLQLHISTEEWKRSRRRRRRRKRRWKKNGIEGLGAQVQLSEERRGTRNDEISCLGNVVDSDGFRAAKPITVFTELIARNRVNCNLTTRCYPDRGAAETSTFVSFASSFVVRARMRAALRPKGVQRLQTVKNYCFPVYRSSRERNPPILGFPTLSRTRHRSPRVVLSSSLPPAALPAITTFPRLPFSRI